MKTVSGYVYCLVISICLFSCNIIPEKHSPAGFDTLQASPYPVIAQPEIFEKAFFKYSTATSGFGDSVVFYQLDIGKLKVESGKLIAADVIQFEEMPPFIQQFPRGDFPVILSIARFSNLDERVAFAQVLFSSDSITHWEYALLEPQKPASIFSDTFYGYGVDAGVGLFIDERSNHAFRKVSGVNPNAIDRYIFKRLEEQSRATWEYTLQYFEGGNLAAFTTGFGDGHYASYIGYDKNGAPCRLVTDFGLINWWKKE
ncbi:MAG: DUF4241 domain-containing protein [Chitinophagaceae bacterium]|nr:DUF4241 domain-containing protein [Chitinophagaceae bacterium]MCW5927783.1 DUF4241 domain-containing protein [Chitinophagaceae bacterium]